MINLKQSMRRGNVYAKKIRDILMARYSFLILMIKLLAFSEHP